MTTRMLPPLLLLALGALACGEVGPGGGAAGDDSAATATASVDSMPATPTTPAPDPAVVCDTIDNSFRCARAIEAAQLPRTPRASRRGDTLLLALASWAPGTAGSAGDTVRLVDRPGEGGGVVYFSFQDHWVDRGWFVVQEQHYEGSEYLLIHHATGEWTRLPARPLLAPGGDRFAVLSFDLAAGYAPNTIQVWRLDEGEPTLEWQVDPDAWGPTDGRWVDEDTLIFSRRCGPDPSTGVECDSRATLRRSQDSWVIAPAEAGD